MAECMLGLLISSNLIRTMVSIAAAVVVYFVMFLLLKGLTKEEMFDFPMGRKMY